MAVITALKFLERLEKEESLRTQLYISRPEDLAEFTQFAQGKGFIVTPEEMKQAISEYEPKLDHGNIEPVRALLGRGSSRAS